VFVADHYAPGRMNVPASANMIQGSASADVQFVFQFAAWIILPAR